MVCSLSSRPSAVTFLHASAKAILRHHESLQQQLCKQVDLSPIQTAPLAWLTSSIFPARNHRRFSCSVERTSPQKAVARNVPSASVTIPPSTSESIRRGEVHLWCLFLEDIRDVDLLRTYETLLCPEELRTVLETQVPAVRTERLLSRALLRLTLARYCGGQVQPHEFLFDLNKYGRPEVVFPPDTNKTLPDCLRDLSFNISHTHSLVTCAVTLGSAVGVDVEESERVMGKGPMAVAKRYFSAAEISSLASISDPHLQHAHFIQLWTLKEAFVKALGKGIAGAPFSGFTISLQSNPAPPPLYTTGDLDSDSTARSPDGHLAISLTLPPGADVADTYGPRPDEWQFLLLRPSPLHYLSVCFKNPRGAVVKGNPGSADRRDEANINSTTTVKMWRTVPLRWETRVSVDSCMLGMAANMLSTTL